MARKIQVFPIATFALIFGAAIAACGSDDKAASTVTTTTTAESTSTSTTVTTAAAAPSAAPSAFQVAQVAAGDQHACAVDSGGAAFCWGYNGQGQLGNGTNADQLSPTRVQTDQSFKSVVSGRYFSCGLMNDGRVFCWGDNSSGQLGNGQDGKGGASANSNVPVAVKDVVRFASLMAGQSHACGLTGAGETYCWGAYASGQLGNGAGAAQTAPIRSAATLKLASLALGGDTNTCGVDAQGTGSCWGNNTFGQLGNGSKTNARQPEPSAVKGGHSFRLVALGRTFACGLDTAGKAWCWGDNRSGQLGDGTTTERLEPVAVQGDRPFVALSAGDAHACGIDSAGVAHCWGSNAFGQLGNGASGTNKLTAGAVSGDVKLAAVSAGEEFTCAVARNNSAYCWGSNRVGWLGDGTTVPKLTPTAVKAP